MGTCVSGQCTEEPKCDVLCARVELNRTLANIRLLHDRTGGVGPLWESLATFVRALAENWGDSEWEIARGHADCCIYIFAKPRRRFDIPPSDNGEAGATA